MASSVSTAVEQYSDTRYEAMARLSDWNNPMHPCFRSPTRSSRIFDLLSEFLTLILSVGIRGMPRHVRNGLPNSVIVGGGTPRRVHSRPNAAMERG